MKESESKIIRSTVGDGRWFPADGAQLRSMVEGYIEEAEAPGVSGRIVAGIAPHAGYIYSGSVAGYTFRAIKDNAHDEMLPETVVVVGFSHRGGFKGAAVMDGDMLESPLGQTDLDRDAGEFLAGQSDRIYFDYGPHFGEHSAENELPFVQASLSGAKLVVILTGDHEEATVNALVRALAALSAKKRIVVIASTDLLHHADYEKVSRTDEKTMGMISGLDDSGLIESWDYGSQVCCGLMPVLTVMRYSEEMGCRAGTKLYYRNSGDDYPESRGSWVVGYGSVVFSVDG